MTLSVRSSLWNVVVGIYIAVSIRCVPSWAQQEMAADGVITDYDVTCDGLTNKFGVCACKENPTTILGAVLTSAFIGCTRPELTVNANFTGPQQKIQVMEFCIEEGIGDATCTTIDYDPVTGTPTNCTVSIADDSATNTTITTCSSCTLCQVPIEETDENGTVISTTYMDGVQVDCRNVPYIDAGEVISTPNNGTTCQTLLDRYQYEFIRIKDTSNDTSTTTGESSSGTSRMTRGNPQRLLWLDAPWSYSSYFVVLVFASWLLF